MSLLLRFVQPNVEGDHRVRDEEALIRTLGAVHLSVPLRADVDPAWRIPLVPYRPHTIYLTVVVHVWWLVFPYLEALKKQLPEVQFVLVEDLLSAPRPYRFDSKHLKFVRRLCTTLPTSILRSSQQLRNRWGEGDVFVSPLIPGLLEEPHRWWERIHAEISFESMINQGFAVPRLISIQSIATPDGRRPIYRHPNDSEPENVEMVPLVRELLTMVEAVTGVVGLNHVLIQYYRDGRDTIASHSDKTLDVDLHTPIVNLTVGATRTMYLQHKDDPQRREKLLLRHGECVVFGLRTNQYWWHEIPKEVTQLGGRVSFTFRRMVTFRDKQGVVVGQGSPYKTAEEVGVKEVRQRDRAELIHAFSEENKQHATFDWARTYGEGFL